MVKKADIPMHVVATAMDLAAERGWRSVSLGEIAEAAGLKLSQLYDVYPSKRAILHGLSQHADRAMLAEASADPDAAEESTRDRLFALLMARFDALLPYKDGIAAVLRDTLGNPAAALAWGGSLRRSMTWALEAVGPVGRGWLLPVQVKGLSAIYLSTMLVWLRDESADMSKTMAALDKRLRRAEAIMGGREDAAGNSQEAAEQT